LYVGTMTLTSMGKEGPRFHRRIVGTLAA
jgi:hypothetical protein